jgi:hypothetical protein
LRDFGVAAERGAFIAKFAGSDRLVVDYLGEEVLQAQTVEIQDFLLRTSILERLSGPLCDAVLGHEGSSQRNSQATLDRLLRHAESQQDFLTAVGTQAAALTTGYDYDPGCPATAIQRGGFTFTFGALTGQRHDCLGRLERLVDDKKRAARAQHGRPPDGQQDHRQRKYGQP